MGITEVVFVVVFGLFALLMVAGLVFWILKLVEIAGIPDDQFRAAGTEKVTWLIVVVLVGAIGALIWQFARRQDVLDAAGRIPAPRPGWYPEPGTGTQRWWDGSAWTDHRHAPPAP